MKHQLLIVLKKYRNYENNKGRKTRQYLVKRKDLIPVYTSEN
jgi:hypothetical protein